MPKFIQATDIADAKIVALVEMAGKVSYVETDKADNEAVLDFVRESTGRFFNENTTKVVGFVAPYVEKKRGRPPKSETKPVESEADDSPI